MIFHTQNAEETIQLGKKIGEYLKPGTVIAMEGTLAAGKTTITKGIALALDVKETITSPTFTLISEYQGKMPLYHMDVYRLDSSEDFLNLGVEDMIYDGKGVAIIEWSEKIRSELPANTITIRLESAEDGSRKITIENWPFGELK
ncbi:MAG: tRNA (adenosine(37)-N6)-threonylcarbamoyltransferase complex ATPase subunit type 1 TsaE [Spirochaetaceae bacterium]|nr:tRNA (adenosine(37)-N6)-threonylcarbamoyltransferase complex ATPase subunit type 1 TsaE [Spirochaetaceae bacterium]